MVVCISRFGNQVVKRVIQWIKSNNDIAKTSSIIDLGCGNGYTCCELVKQGYVNVTGIDYSSNAIDLAQSISQSEELNIKYHVNIIKSIAY